MVYCDVSWPSLRNNWLETKTNSMQQLYWISKLLCNQVEEKHYEFVTGNMGLMSLRYAKRVFAKTEVTLFINLSLTDTIKSSCNNF